jgi:hypothetical protein
MPRIFDNIDQSLLPALRETIQLANHADFCVGYFNLRGWKQLDSYIEKWSGGDGNCCRLVIGMQKLPQEELREALSLIKSDGELDNNTVIRLKKKLAEEFREQLSVVRDKLGLAIHSALRIGAAVVRNLRDIVPDPSIPPPDGLAWRQLINPAGTAVSLRDIAADLWKRGIPVIPREVLPSPSFQGIAGIVDGRPVILPATSTMSPVE